MTKLFNITTKILRKGNKVYAESEMAAFDRQQKSLPQSLSSFKTKFIF